MSDCINNLQILVTGANGFLGRAFCLEALSKGIKVRGSTRNSTVLPSKFDTITVGDINGNTGWQDALMGCEIVVHLASRVHVMAEKASIPLYEFRRVNVQGTLNLARQAFEAGARRFVFVSSIGVNGAETFGKPFTSEDTVAPHSAYAISKYEAELSLQALAAETGMEVVIIRPPLVYGPGAPGNFGSLIRWLKRGVPLPLGAIHNKRSLVSIDNLVDLILTCLTHPSAPNQTFLVSDDEDVSTADLLRRMSLAMGFSARLIPLPVNLLKLAAALMGRQDVAQKLCGSLQLDIEKTKRMLGWSPLISLDEGLRRAARNIE